ncbi:hypothetical protein KJ966_19490 [bacterium]|nr:hypothetical protein [bacterium]
MEIKSVDRPPCGIPVVYRCIFCGDVKCGKSCSRGTCTFTNNQVKGNAFIGMKCSQCDNGEYDIAPVNS